MKKQRRVSILALVFIFISGIGLAIYFSLFHLPSEKSIIEEFMANEEKFTIAAKFLSNQKYDVVINQENIINYTNEELNSVIKDLNYNKIIYVYDNSIRFIKENAFGGSSVGIIYDNHSGGGGYSPDSYYIKKVKDNWYYFSYWL